MTNVFLLSRRSVLLLGSSVAWRGLAHAGPAPATPAAPASPWFAREVQAPSAPPPTPALAAGAPAHLAHWPRLVLRLVVKYQQNPLRAARALAHVQVALHDAWAHASRTWPGAGAAGELAAHQAAARVMAQLYPNETAGVFEAHRAHLADALTLPDEAHAAAAAVGNEVGEALVARSLRDGAGRSWPPRQRPADFLGAWQPTWPLYAANPAEGLAGQWRPWVQPSAGRHDPPPPPRPGSARHRQEAQEVLDAARALDDGQRRAAHAWHLEAGSVTPAGVWMQHTLEALGEAAAQAPTPAEGTALLLRGVTAVAVAMHDAFIDCWRVKVRDWSERPITAVRRDLDPGFEPLLVTPGFPAYVSGHATVSAAAAGVLGHFLPQRRAAFAAMAQEAAMSRLWGGIHFRSDNDEGLRLGQSVAQDVLAALRGPPAPGAPGQEAPPGSASPGSPA